MGPNRGKTRFGPTLVVRLAPAHAERGGTRGARRPYADASTPAGALPSYSQIAATFEALADERSNS
ncbi:hypothetical protein SAMN05216329_1914 [Curtobacterium sp. YR515]|nr:hypothetical protein SAMN05216329_1914 [Curtobacterium sp. YR515]